VFEPLMKEMLPPQWRWGGRGEPAGRFGGLRRKPTLQACLRDRFSPQTRNHSVIRASSPFATIGQRGQLLDGAAEGWPRGRHAWERRASNRRTGLLARPDEWRLVVNIVV
jgi:hypothetical protein